MPGAEARRLSAPLGGGHGYKMNGRTDVARPCTWRADGTKAGRSAMVASTVGEGDNGHSLSKYCVTSARVIASPRPESRRMFSTDIAEKSVG